MDIVQGHRIQDLKTDAYLAPGSLSSHPALLTDSKKPVHSKENQKSVTALLFYFLISASLTPLSTGQETTRLMRIKADLHGLQEATPAHAPAGLAPLNSLKP